MNDPAPIVSEGHESESDPTDGVDTALRTIVSTQTCRYLNISAWAILLMVFAPFAVAVGWYVLTITAGFVRTLIEKHYAASSGGVLTNRVRVHYSMIAMASCAFWAAAPVIVMLSQNPQAPGAAIFMIATGLMLAYSQFHSSPKNALIVTSPYFIAYLICLALTANTPAFSMMLVAGPLMVVAVTAVLMIGYHTQQDLRNVANERDLLIDELREARKSAERASEAKSMFLANMSHEIRTPMNGVLGMAELLASTRLDSRQRIYSETIHKSGGALLTIINDILDFSKIEAGKLELEEGEFDLRASVEDVALLISSRAQEKQIEVIVRFQPDLAHKLIGDGGRIRQVITNLVGNAVKFTESGYVLVDVSGESTDTQASLRIEVTDTGVGIESEKVAHIFDAFQQADISTTRRYGGTGLGLSISSRLVAAMGGTIGVTSTIGEGSTFWVQLTLPVSEDVGVVRDTTFDAGGRRILIVDDIDVNRQILEEQLQSWGCETHSVASGAQALACLREMASKGEFFDLAILDFCMPEMDGEELARRIKDDPAIAQTHLMALTSVDGAGDARRFREIGVGAYLVKPVRGTTLFETIAEILGDVTSPDVKTCETSVEREANIVQSIAKPSPNQLIQRRLLLAEDNEVNQLVIRHMLDPNEYHIVIAGNGREAVELFEATPDEFDVILMDVSMPEMDGYEATQEIRKFETEQLHPRTPIICLTAHVMERDIEHAFEVGMDDYVSKPVSKDKIERCLARWVDESADDKGSAVNAV